MEILMDCVLMYECKEQRPLEKVVGSEQHEICPTSPNKLPWYHHPLFTIFGDHKNCVITTQLGESDTVMFDLSRIAPPFTLAIKALQLTTEVCNPDKKPDCGKSPTLLYPTRVKAWVALWQSAANKRRE